FTLETAPNGGRINLGFEGNTAEASRSATTAAAGQLQFSAATYSVAENGGSASITITRTNGSDGTVTVQVNLSGGSASSGTDYTPPANNTLSFGPGVTSQNLSIPISDDNLVEGNETVNLALQNVTG